MGRSILAIDQSLSGTAVCHLDGGRPLLLETVDTSQLRGMERILKVRDRVNELLTSIKPDAVVMEDYAFSATTNNLTALAELGGILKLAIWDQGYREGADVILRGERAFVVQTVAEMKKFCLGQGNVKKDSRYLLTVFDRLKQRFDDDNQADAYMHAYRASVLIGVIRGKVPMENLSFAQQESLMSRGIKKSKVTKTKSMKLSDEEKRRLVTC